jgi:aspartyl-tRNA(Asn)/glutamyl-tRNA(Gln) amidotransferase subunit C
MPPEPKTDRDLSRAKLDHVAKLANVSLTEAEAATLAGELDSILKYVETLDSVDTSAIPPTTGGGIGPTGWRADEPIVCLSHKDALAAAPRAAHGGFAVPAFVSTSPTSTGR